MPKPVPAAGEAMPAIARRTLLQGLVFAAVVPATAATVAAAPRDPLLETIRSYRSGCDVYEAGARFAEDEDAFFEATYAPQMRALCHWKGPAGSPEGAIEALKLIKEDKMLCDCMGEAMVDAVMEFLVILAAGGTLDGKAVLS